MAEKKVVVKADTAKKETPKKEYTCTTSCFRDGRLFQKGDIFVCDYPEAPKHFEGYKEKKAPPKAGEQQEIL